MPPAMNTAARERSSCRVITPRGPFSSSFAPAGRLFSARLKALPSRMRVATASSASKGALTSEKMRCLLFGSGGGSVRNSVIAWPGLKTKPGGLVKRNAMVPAATSSCPLSRTS